MMSKVLWTRVSSEVAGIAEKLAVEVAGITISECIRELIISDIDNRLVFNAKLRARSKDTPVEVEG